MRNFYSLFLGLIFLTVTACSSSGKQDFQSVSVQEFANIIADTTTVILVDVRTAEEYGSGHIENALNIDVKQADFEEVAIKALSKDKTIAVYCRSGRRSKKAAKILSKNGYKVIELDSGYSGWTKN